jgi:hypothetical protein
MEVVIIKINEGAPVLSEVIRPNPQWAQPVSRQEISGLMKVSDRRGAHIKFDVCLHGRRWFVIDVEWDLKVGLARITGIHN